MVRFDAESKPKLIQRRDFVRVDTDRPARAALDETDSIPMETRALNLSGGGALLERIDGAGEGDQVWIYVDLGDGDAPIEFRARVRRVTPQGWKGCQIEHISEAARERLIHYVFEEQRQRPAVRGQ
jgi:c-di-GMP-binding flagellar brake protein YcgR